MQERTWKRGTIWSGIALGALVVLSVILYLTIGVNNTAAGGGDNGGGNTAGSSAPAVPFDPAILTVTTSQYDCIAEAEKAGVQVDKERGVIRFDSAGLKGVPPRVYSDSISTPIVATDGELARDEVQLAICLDPGLGISTGTELSNLTVAGYNVGDLNPWLTKYGRDPAKTQEEVNKILLYSGQNYTAEEVQAHFKAAAEYLQWAGLLNTLLDRFKVEGFQALPSVLNLHFAAGGMVVAEFGAFVVVGLV